MNMSSNTDITPLCLKFLKFSGCHPKRTNIQNLIYVVNFSLLTCIMCLVLYQICFTEFTFAKTFQSLESLFILTQVCIDSYIFLYFMSAIFFQPFCRYIRLIKLTNKYAKQIELKRHFLSTDEVKDVELKNECINMLREGKQFCFTYVRLCVPVLLLWAIVPFIKTGKVPFVCYIPDGTYIYIVIIQAISITLIVPFILGHDFLINNILFQLSVQFKILGYKFTELNFDTADQTADCFFSKLSHLVNYHNFLLRYVQNLFSDTGNRIQ